MNPLPTGLLFIDGIGMTYNGRGEVNHVIENISFDIREKDLTAVVGASGCGKTTLLRIVCGLQKPTAGRIMLHNEPITKPHPEILLVYQHYEQTLLPWKKAIDNVLFGLLRKNRAQKRRNQDKAMDLLASIGMTDAANRYPWELSGGMQQRIALARALIRKPKVLLLDEPFTALDEPTRKALKDLLIQLQCNEHCAIVLVSHDLNEVADFSRRIVILDGTPSRVKDIIENKGCNSNDLRSFVHCRPDH